jgi:hypothetical protein
VTTLPTLPLPAARRRLRPSLAPLLERLRRARLEASARAEAEALRRDVLDHACRDLSVRVTPDALELDYDGRRVYARTLVVRDRPPAVPDGWLAPILFDLGGDVQVAVRADPIPKARALTMLNAQRATQTTINLDRAGANAQSDLAADWSARSAEEVHQLVMRGAEALFAVELALTLRAPTRAALDDLERAVREQLDFLQEPLGSTRYQQRKGYLTAGVAYAAETLDRRWTAETTTLAFTLPFLAHDPGTTSGAYLCRSLDDRRPIFLDPWAVEEGWPAGHGVVPAPNGSGKTVCVGTLIAELYALARRPRILAVDPAKGDLRRLVKALDGEIVSMSTRPDLRLNPFDLPPKVYLSGTGEEAEQNPVLEQTRLATGLLLLMCSSESDDDETYLETAVLRAYHGRGIHQDDEATWEPGSGEVPLLADVVAQLPDEAGPLRRKLDRFLTGTLAGLFAGPTNLTLKNRLVSFDLERADPRLKPIATWLVSNWVWQTAKRDREPTLLYLEEAKTLLEQPETARMVAHLYSLGRAYRLAVWSATQLISDYEETQEGRRALENAHTVVLLKQGLGAARAAERYRLPPEDQQFLEGCERGHGILITPKRGGSRARVYVDPSPWVLELMGGPKAGAEDTGDGEGGGQHDAAA